MRLVKAVTREFLHQVEDFGCRFCGDAAFCRTLNEDGTLPLHFFDIFLTHGTTQKVGAAQRIAPDSSCNQHHLFLIDHDAVGFAKNGLHTGIEILHFFSPEFTVNKVRNLIHRTGTIKCVQGDKIFQTVRLCLPQLFTHAVRFKLEHCSSVSLLEELQRFLVVGWDSRQVKLGTRIESINVLCSLRQNRQCCQTQEVELHKAYIFDVFFIKLTDRIFGLAVSVIERAEIRQFARCNQNATRVHTQVASQALEFLSVAHQLNIILLLSHFLKRRFHLGCFCERHIKPRLLRDQFGQFVNLFVVHIEHTANVSNHGLCAHGTECDDLAHCIHTIGTLHVLNGAITVVLTEVNVKVRHRNAFRIEETFEQQSIMQRIQVRNTQRIGHKRTSTGPATGPHCHTVSFGPVDKVLHDKEVTGKLHGRDCLELVVQAFDIFRAASISLRLIRIQKLKTALQTLMRELHHIFVERHTFRSRKQRQLRLLQNSVQIAALSNHHRVVNSLRNVSKERSHLLFGLQILLFRIKLRTMGIRQHVSTGNAAAHFMSIEIFSMQELHRVCRHHGQSRLNSQLGNMRHNRFIVFSTGSLHF